MNLNLNVVGARGGRGHGFEPQHLRPTVAPVEHRLHYVFLLVWGSPA